MNIGTFTRIQNGYSAIVGGLYFCHERLMIRLHHTLAYSHRIH
jgi:hypothetical protein